MLCTQYFGSLELRSSTSVWVAQPLREALYKIIIKRGLGFNSVPPPQQKCSKVKENGRVWLIILNSIVVLLNEKVTIKQLFKTFKQTFQRKSPMKIPGAKAQLCIGVTAQSMSVWQEPLLRAYGRKRFQRKGHSWVM